MPDYNYQCARCGVFTASQPMSAFNRPRRCPTCRALAPRAISAPSLAGGAADGEWSCGAGMSSGHPGGCACCRTGGGFCAEAV